MTKKELGSRLETARKAVGLNLTEAAKRLEFHSYQTLKKVEEGKREVKASELSLFAKVYFCSINFLLGEKESRQAVPFLWRKAPSGKKKKEIETQIIHFCEQYHLLESLLGLQEEEKFRFLDISLNDICSDIAIDKLASNTSRLLGLGSRPAFTLQKVLEQKYAVKIVYRSLANIGSGASMLHPTFGAVVVINSDEAPWRCNYNLAHELFHLITGKIISFNDLKNKEMSQDIERKAERFASTILLPEREVVEEISARFNAQNSFSFSDLVDIAREFGVSKIALLYRLKNLRLLKWENVKKLSTNKTLMNLDKDIRREDWNKEPTAPERFHTLAIRCLRKGLISRGKFTEMVGIDRSDIDSFVKRYGLMDTEGVPIEIMVT